MRTVVENIVDYGLKGMQERNMIIKDETTDELKTEFLYLLHICILAEDEKTLRRMFSCLTAFHFVWGFGGRHMWIKQRAGDYIYPDRLIIVEF